MYSLYRQGTTGVQEYTHLLSQLHQTALQPCGASKTAACGISKASVGNRLLLPHCHPKHQAPTPPTPPPPLFVVTHADAGDPSQHCHIALRRHLQGASNTSPSLSFGVELSTGNPCTLTGRRPSLNAVPCNAAPESRLLAALLRTRLA
jgi:hypothetical protein